MSRQIDKNIINFINIHSIDSVEIIGIQDSKNDYFDKFSAYVSATISAPTSGALAQGATLTVPTTSLAVGDNVNFDSSKLGKNVTGVVTKIAIKYVTVRNDRDGGLWKIPANMLEIVEGQMVTA